MELLEGMRKDCVEGNISWFPERQFTLADLVRKHKPRKILEVGFNMGHSMLLICQQLVEIIKEDKTFNIEPIQIYVLDIGEHDCVTNNFDILQKHFFGWNIHLFLIKGDSNFTLPRFLNEYDDNFDFVEIDGCHTYDCAKKDIENVLNRIAPNGLIYVDDFASTKAPIPDVDNAIKDIGWNNFDTYNIDGVFWGNRKVSQVFDKNDLVTNITEETPQPLNKEQVNHPQHYGGESNVYEAIKVIDAWDLGFSLGNTVKYISRAGKKNKEKELEDLKKALWYLEHYIETLEKK